MWHARLAGAVVSATALAPPSAPPFAPPSALKAVSEAREAHAADDWSEIWSEIKSAAEPSVWSRLLSRGTDAAERGLPDADDAAVLAAMVADPILIERPLVETDNGVRLCRPQDVVLEIL